MKPMRYILILVCAALLVAPAFGCHSGGPADATIEAGGEDGTAESPCDLEALGELRTRCFECYIPACEEYMSVSSGPDCEGVETDAPEVEERNVACQFEALDALF